MGDSRPLIFDLFEFPITTLFIIVCVAIWALLKRYSLDYPHVGVSYKTFVLQGEYWRMWTASFSHISIIHLALNMSSLWAYRFLEKAIGSYLYFQLSLCFVVLSILMMMWIYHFLIFRIGRASDANTIGVGYSCVVFAWMAWTSVVFPSDVLNLYFISLPISLAPFGNLIFTSIMVPNASFAGHLAGLICGYAVGFGLLSWLTQYWFLTLCAWVLIAVVGSLVKGGFRIPGIDISPPIWICFARQVVWPEQRTANYVRTLADIV